MFRGNAAPAASPYTRLSDSQPPPALSRPRAGIRTPYNDPPPSQFPVRDRKPPPLRPASSFIVESCPSDALALSNCLIVHPSDFQQGQHVLVKGAYPLTIRHDNTGKLQPGRIGASALQRQWIGLSISGDEVSVEQLPPAPHPSAPSYLQALDLEIGFFRPRYETQDRFSADEMTQDFIKAFSGVVFAIDEAVVFEFHGHNLKALVKGLSLAELSEKQWKGAPAQRSTMYGSMGVLMERTDITFMQTGTLKIKASAKKPAPNAILAPNFKFKDMGIGGLDAEFSEIFRRAFASRVFPAGLVEKLGIEHVKGLLLHGPPGTGKTLIARQIGKMLNAREPKIVNGPEILNKYVGASEENIRKLFEDAEKEYKEKGDESGLHIIIFDELDAIFKQRGSTSGGTGVGDTVVNQILSKMDGVEKLNNILVIGMTNRIDMIDEALLRPGRLEVHMEISIPDENGRLQILAIHTATMKKNGVMDSDVDLNEIATRTKNFTGAEIGGLIKNATSFAFNRHVKVGTMAGISDDVDQLRVNRGDFMNALEEVHPAYGVSEEELEQAIQNGIIPFDHAIDELLRTGNLFIKQVRSSERSRLVSILLYGPPGSGKTALAATLAQESGYPFIKLISPDSMVGFSEQQKVAAISKVFADSYKSPLSVIVVDCLERLLDWTPVGPRFSNAVLQTLLVLLSRRPPKGRRLLILATSSLQPVLSEIGFTEVFDSELRVPPIATLQAIEHVLRSVDLFSSEEETRETLALLEEAGFGTRDDVTSSRLHIGIKKLLSIIEMARQEQDNVPLRLRGALIGLGM